MCPEVLPAAQMTKRQAKPSKEEILLCFLKKQLHRKKPCLVEICVCTVQVKTVYYLRLDC